MLPLTLCPGLTHCSSLVQSQVQPSQVSGCQFNRAPGTVCFCADLCGAPLRSSVGHSRTGCWLHQSRSLAGVLHLFYIWEFPHSVGNKGPSGNASLTHLLCASSESLNPGLFSQRHLEWSHPILVLMTWQKDTGHQVSIKTKQISIRTHYILFITPET